MSRNSARSRTCFDGLTVKAPFPGPAFGLLLLRGSGICGETGLVATKPAAKRGSGRTCLFLPSCALQQFSSSSSSAASLSAAFAAGHRTALESSWTAPRDTRPAPTASLPALCLSLPPPLQKLSQEALGTDREGAGQGPHALPGGLCCVVTSTKHPPAVLSICCPSGMVRELEEQDSKIPRGQDQDTLRGEGKKETKTSDAITHHLAPPHRCPAILQRTATLERLPTVFQLTIILLTTAAKPSPKTPYQNHPEETPLSLGILGERLHRKGRDKGMGWDAAEL